jgi:choline-sulfatase
LARNLLILMSDEHQARAMGCAGHPLVRTPNLDRLAASGTRFTAAYTPSPICVPARAAFAAGQHVHQTGLWDNAMPYTGTPPGWGHALQAAGVRVESIGKLHYRAPEDPVGFDAEHIPMMVEGGVGMVWASIRAEAERWAPDARMLGSYIGPGESKYTEYDRAIVARTADWLADRAGDPRPWCLFVGLVAPHFPLVCPPDFYALYPHDRLPPPKLHPDDGHPRHPWVDKQNAYMDAEAGFRDAEERCAALAAYFGLCSWLDHSVGLILAALERAGLDGATDIVYTSDHGDNAGARGLWGKSNLYEESAAVPLIVRGMGLAPGVRHEPVSLLDLSASICAQFGTVLPGAAGLPLTDPAAAAPDRPILSQYHAAGAVTGAYMLRRGRWKLIHYVGFAPELFDLATDPDEARNLAADPAHAAVLADLDAALRRLLDPEGTDARAHADQRQLVKRLGGAEAVRQMGPQGATQPPRTG